MDRAATCGECDLCGLGVEATSCLWQGEKLVYDFSWKTSPLFGRWTGCRSPASCDGPPPPSTTWENVGAGARRTTVTGLQKNL